MSIFEFLMVLVSLIIGLGIAELLTGLAQAIRNRKSIHFYWVHSLIIIITFIVLLQHWWEIWSLNNVEVWSFLGLVMMMGGPIGLFLIAHLLFPENLQNSELRSYYYEQMKPIYWIALFTVVISSSYRPILFGDNIFHVANLSSFVLLIILASLASIKNALFHSITVLIMLMLIIIDIIIYGIQIQQ